MSTTEPAAKKPHALIILDGFGHREDPRDNAIHHANTPNWDRLVASAPHTLISGSGEDVGLPAGQMGNSEVGHMSLGSGRIIYQNITRIDKAIRDGDFFNNPAYIEAIDAAVKDNKAVHVMGLLSPGGVHSHEKHIFALLKMAAQRGAKKLFLHAILDGRDMPPRSAQASLEKAQAVIDELGVGHIASVIGRFYAMDRDNRWDRVQLAYDMYTNGDCAFENSNAVDALNAAYAREENDEFVQATAIPFNGDKVCINDDDSLIFMNFRADRAREICYAFSDDDFDGFERKARPQLAGFVMTTEYASNLKLSCAFAPEAVEDSFGELLAKTEHTQLRIAETEKYAHVTFFFSGGREEEYAGETRVLVPSPDVKTYDLKPEMSAHEVTDKLVEAIKSGKYDALICNYANGDMVGHTGDFDAAVKAVETLDTCIARVEQAILEMGGDALITADHGNCEQMLDYDTQQKHTQHTTEHVPFVYIGERDLSFNDGGRLCDVAPTLLDLMNIAQPQAMTGHSLIK